MKTSIITLRLTYDEHDLPPEQWFWADCLGLAPDSVEVVTDVIHVPRALWEDNLTAWEGEEESVQDEHADLIERLRAADASA